MTRPLQAIIFDFDGVIADSEPLHLRAFQAALAEEGILLTTSEYYARYLGFDDAGLFGALSRDLGLTMTDAKVDALLARKSAKLQDMMRAGEILFPGASEFIRAAAAEVPIAIASGALRHEISEVVKAADVAELFGAVVASEDTRESKPSPAPYLLAFDRLRQVSAQPLDPRRCVAIEDSRWGLESASGAGLRCVGVTSSYPAEALEGAELIVAGLHELTLSALDRLCSS